MALGGGIGWCSAGNVGFEKTWTDPVFACEGGIAVTLCVLGLSGDP